MVLGASFNSVEQNAAFAKKFGFGFKLLCDTDRKLATALGASSDPNARRPQRMSFLIDEHGKIARVYDKVDPRDHPAQVLADVVGA